MNTNPLSASLTYYLFCMDESQHMPFNSYKKVIVYLFSCHYAKCIYPDTLIVLWITQKHIMLLWILWYEALSYDMKVTIYIYIIYHNLCSWYSQCVCISKQFYIGLRKTPKGFSPPSMFDSLTILYGLIKAAAIIPRLSSSFKALYSSSSFYVLTWPKYWKIEIWHWMIMRWLATHETCVVTSAYTVKSIHGAVAVWPNIEHFLWRIIWPCRLESHSMSFY